MSVSLTCAISTSAAGSEADIQSRRAFVRAINGPLNAPNRSPSSPIGAVARDIVESAVYARRTASSAM